MTDDLTEVVQTEGADTAPLIVRVDLEDGKPPLDINVDAITFDDLALLEKPAQDTKMSEIVELFNRVVVGGVGKLPIRNSVTRIGTAIGRAMQEAGNPNS